MANRTLTGKNPAICWLLSLCLTILLVDTAFAQERHLHTYALRHALPEQVIPVLSAQIGTDSSVTAYRQQLILNVTDIEYRNIQTLLERLDTAPHSLLISVRKQSQGYDDDERYGVQGRIGEGAVQVESGSGWERRTETRVTINRSTTQNMRNAAQQVRALEGTPAFISAGNTISMRSGYAGEHELVPVDSGFYATARIVDDEVIVDIDQHDDRMQGRRIATQSLQTQVRGTLGEWIPLGGLNSSQTDDGRTLTSYSSTATRSLSDLAIKVELLDH